jgi:hypothetical protein
MDEHLSTPEHLNKPTSKMTSKPKGPKRIDGSING